MENILEVNNLSKKYKDFQLDNVSFSVPYGYIMGFIGPNGAGKTTTIKLIMNLVKKDAGEIRVFGRDHQQEEREIKQRIGFVYEDCYYYEELSVLEMKRIIAPFYRNWDERVFQHYLAAFGLPGGKKIKELSRGMKTKFSLAVALSHHADLIVLDEPTSGLDPVFREEFLEILQDLLQDGGKGVLFSTHITADLDKIADYVCFINEGKVVFNGVKDEILGSYAIVKGGKELLTEESRRLFVGLRENEFGFQALCRDPARVKAQLGDRALFEKADLHDIMLYTVRRVPKDA
ncbi:MAG: Daunorubicin/doxorubicin resistance ATP-binding protein DrrA [Pelotomaculum sp. PtaB.Bin104]|nr:MAG: Daunorubicin/doxorubicin resistance ATP-binding protein DrrA [Pelotomaculum sp. PtaB.Bin104]